MPVPSLVKKAGKLLNQRRKEKLAESGRRDPFELLRRAQATDFANEQIVDTPVIDTSPRRDRVV